ncbi:MAG: hypothetical protein RLZZ200_544 [Pseudomonadota bacterium]|jgi:chemotaxis protein MotB
MADEGKRPIIVVKKKKQAAGHHGGAWKVAYADFVTAMMAFFLVMWLVASVTKEQRAALFDYFKNPSMEPGKSVKPAPGQNGPGGASTSPINLGGGLDAPKSSPVTEEQGLGQPTSVAEAKKLAEAEEERQLDGLKKDLEEAIEKSLTMQQFKNQLLLDLTPEGLRIQIVDQQSRAMFDSGSSQLKDYTVKILAELAKHLNTVPNRLSVSGHTDAKPYGGTGKGYTNWELSADRANAARRTLLDGGLSEGKIARVVGLASSVLFVRNEPLNPINRRISIIVMTKKAEDAALATDAPTVRVDGESAAAGVGDAGVPAAATGGAGAPPAAAPPSNIKTPIAPPINLPMVTKP